MSPAADLCESNSTAAPTVKMRMVPTKKTERPTLRTELAKLERSLFDAFEAAQLQQFER